MTEHVYKKIEIVGTSKTSIDDAIQKAIGRHRRRSKISIGLKLVKYAAMSWLRKRTITK